MTSRALFCVALLAPALVWLAPGAQAAVSYQNCTELHKSYPHGIGRADAHDKTSGKPVTTFTKDTAGYNKAMKAKSDLDRDKDGIACEKA